MSVGFTQANLYLTVTTPLGEDKLLLRELHGEEQISGLFHFTLEMVSEENDLDFSQIVGKNATVTINLADGTQRYVNGIVGRFMQAGRDARFTTYYADLYPWLWLLSMTADCRIFQNQTVPEIIEAVFSDLGFTDYRNALTATYAPREYCVQYHESAFDFVSRLMEDEGIFYFFEHTADKHTLVLADDASAHTDCPGLTSANYWPYATSWEREDVITSCTYEQQVAPNSYAVDDFNFETSTTDLFVKVSGTDGNLQIYEYPGGFTATDAGEAKANVRIAAYELRTKLLRGHGHCRVFGPGLKFTLADHERADFNRAYVLRWVSHAATPDRYANTFEAFPDDVPYRPPRMTKKPVIAGSQTAIVVGPSGEEILTDQYGRVKVQFHWDQKGTNDENSSCWIRVAHGWAGKAWGAIFIPRIGQEVIVSFLEGDPDRPIITGGVYNAQQTVPYTLPDEQTKSTIKSYSSKGGEGFNEIRFEDKKDSEEIFINAQKDMNSKVGNNRVAAIKKSRQVFVMEGDPTVDEEAQDVLVVEGTRKVTVKKADKEEIHTNEGKYTHTVAKDFSLTVDGDNLTITAAGALTIKGKSITIETTQEDLKLKSAANLSAEASQALTNKSGTELKNEAGTSLTNKSGTDLKNEAGTSLTNKASISLTNDGGVSLENKASASQTVDGGGMLTLKGGLVKIN